MGLNAWLAQLVEPAAVNRVVVSSSLTPGANDIVYMANAYHPVSVACLQDAYFSGSYELT